MADNKVSYRIPSGRNAYVIGFRHPVVKDAAGNGKKIQRGAGTSDELEVKRIAADLQELISEQKWHNKSMKGEAEGRFDQIAVDAFFDYMNSDVEDNLALDAIPLKTLADGYPTQAIIGQSGAGKTSLVRKLLGTSKDYFPTTSNNRTTTCDMEFIRCKDNTYKLAVQFFSRNEIEAVLLDNLSDAMENILSQEPIDDMKLLITMLNHREMANRLTYTLGQPYVGSDDEEDDDTLDNVDTQNEDYIPDGEIDTEEQDRWLWDIEERVKNIGLKYKAEGRSFEEIESELSNSDDILMVVNDIIMAIIKKFDGLKDGKKTNPKSIWPDGWYYETTEYEAFIKTTKIFVSNNYLAWGRLLTPLVKAIRISGPFVEDGMDRVEPLVITDGIGLGHTTNSSSIPASVLNRCTKADVIVVVDNASSPLMNNTKDAIKSLIEYGYADKLILAFSKMDLIEGGNYRGMTDKKNNVKQVLQNYLHFLRKQERTVLSELEVQSILDNCVFFSKLNEDSPSKVTQKGLKDINEIRLRILQKNISTKDVHLEYEALKLYYYLKEATQDFRNVWGEKTGYSAVTKKTEHWSRIRALSRRLGLLGEETYCELQPLTDFAVIVQEKINTFINMPDDIKPKQAGEEVVDELKRQIKRTIGSGFRDLNQKRMWKDAAPHSEWEKAYYEMGTGSRYRRARIIEGIFDGAAPYLADIPTLSEGQRIYLSEVVKLVEDVLTQYDCKLLKFNY